MHAFGPFALAALLTVSAPTAQDGAAARPAPHPGPGAAPGDSGPHRYVPPLYENFDALAALRDAEYADQWYRTPGGPAYNLTLERIAERLRSVGFGTDERLRLRYLVNEMEHPAWTPRSASLVMRGAGGPPAVLHAFSHSSDHDRVMLPLHAPAADVEGRPVFSLDEVEAGSVLVMEAQISASILRRAERRGVVAILSSAHFPFTIDPTGRERHHDAILWTKVPPGTTLPVAYISPRSSERIAEAVAEGRPVRLSFIAEVEYGGRELKTLVAEVVGAERPTEAVAIASHVQEPGAGDNASGVAGLTESACVLVRLLKSGELHWPARTVAFIWGDEMQQSRAWLDEGRYTVLAGISADMLGQSYAETGAIALLERSKDPGAVLTIPPDRHTPWGAGEVLPEDLSPNGLAIIARAALADVARHVGGWTTSENPWEGGSDHDVFLERGIPGVLLWHFTDFTYHTSLDRMPMLDPEELRRSCVAVFATALAVADAGPEDLERYLASNELERELRKRATERAVQTERIPREQGHAADDLWGRWCDGAAEWLRALCGAK